MDYHLLLCLYKTFLRPFVKQWRSKAIKAIIYIDDGIRAFHTFELAKPATHLVKNDLSSAGYVINKDKNDYIRTSVTPKHRKNSRTTFIYAPCLQSHSSTFRFFCLNLDHSQHAKCLLTLKKATESFSLVVWMTLCKVKSKQNKKETKHLLNFNSWQFQNILTKYCN